MPHYEIKKIEIDSLKPHEKFSLEHFEELRMEIKKDGVLKDPIIVDKDNLVILDGHHRYNALLSLGAKFCPVCLVDYQDEAIGVACWRENEKITKKEVVAAGVSGKLLPVKTSRHHIPDRPTGLNVPLSELQ
ncbi:MAG: ParB N-terminal domain-containing protein [Candidatus Paceibacterota bacterium]